jgi:hypothetical protein
MRFHPKLRRAVVGFLLISMVAVIGGSAWLLWPVWLEFRERTEWERQARELRVSAAQRKWPETKRSKHEFSFTDPQGNSVDVLTYFWSGYWYCISTKHPAQFSASGPELRVYRIETPADDYAAQTPTARDEVTRIGRIATRQTPAGPVEEPALPLEGEEARRVAFVTDFFHVISGQTDGNLGIRYELIHADPAP